MKKHLLLTAVIILFCTAISFSQNVYVTKSGSTYHTKYCKYYSKNSEEIPLWKAKGPYGKTPCPKCKPPVNESKTPAKKKPAPKPKPAPPKK